MKSFSFAQTFPGAVIAAVVAGIILLFIQYTFFAGSNGVGGSNGGLGNNNVGGVKKIMVEEAAQQTKQLARKVLQRQSVLRKLKSLIA